MNTIEDTQTDFLNYIKYLANMLHRPYNIWLKHKPDLMSEKENNITAEEYYEKALKDTLAGKVIEENNLKKTFIKCLEDFKKQ